jgi:hypothetical protein
MYIPRKEQTSGEIKHKKFTILDLLDPDPQFPLLYTDSGPPYLNQSGSESLNPQSRQSADLFLQSSELGLPHPLTGRQCAPPPALIPGGEGTLAYRRGGERVPIPTRGHTCGTL